MRSTVQFFFLLLCALAAPICCRHIGSISEADMEASMSQEEMDKLYEALRETEQEIIANRKEPLFWERLRLQQEARQNDGIERAFSSPAGQHNERITNPQALVRNHVYRDNMIKEEDKRNAFMSLCHFKICPMGRKRTARYLHIWDLLDEKSNRKQE